MKVQRVRQHGFTMIEMIIGITVMGLLSMVMLPLLTMPATAYMDAQRRVELVDQLALVKAKLADDLSLAMPGSLRRTCSATACYLEYLEVRAVGRYRSQIGGTTNFCGSVAANALTIGASDNCFTTLGSMSLSIATSPPVVNSDYVGIEGLAGNPYSLAPAGRLSRLTTYTPIADGVGIRTANNVFPVASPRFHVYLISQPVTYACNTTTGIMTKYWGYVILPGQGTPPAAGPNNARLADGVSLCQMDIASPSTSTLRQTLSLRLRLTKTSGGQPAESAESLIQIAVKEP